MPTILFYTAIIAALLVLGVVVDRLGRKRKSKIIRAVGYPPEWLPTLERHTPWYHRLPWDLREKLQEMALLLSMDKFFRGYGTYERLSGEQIASITAHLALLQMTWRLPPVPALRNIAVGPADLIDARLAQPQAESEWTESWLITVWDETAHHARHRALELNPAYQAAWAEFAPPAEKTNIRFLFAGYAVGLRLDMAQWQIDPPVMPPEVTEEIPFAVGTEIFFRYPEHFAQNFPAHYDGLRRFYKVDPARWVVG